MYNVFEAKNCRFQKKNSKSTACRLETHLRAFSIVNSYSINTFRAALTESGAHREWRLQREALTERGAHGEWRSQRVALTESGAHRVRRSQSEALTESGAHRVRRSQSEALTESGAHGEWRSRREAVTESNSVIYCSKQAALDNHTVID